LVDQLAEPISILEEQLARVERISSPASVESAQIALGDLRQLGLESFWAASTWLSESGAARNLWQTTPGL